MCVCVSVGKGGPVSLGVRVKKGGFECATVWEEVSLESGVMTVEYGRT